ncbi:MAG: hypothetical protein MHM6MM_007996 [Cercozoa sp. M6MM]
MLAYLGLLFAFFALAVGGTVEFDIDKDVGVLTLLGPSDRWFGIVLESSRMFGHALVCGQAPEKHYTHFCMSDKITSGMTCPRGRFDLIGSFDFCDVYFLASYFEVLPVHSFNVSVLSDRINDHGHRVVRLGTSKLKMPRAWAAGLPAQRRIGMHAPCSEDTCGTFQFLPAEGGISL